MSTTLVEIAELVREHHWSVACSEDSNIAHCQSEAYQLSRRLFIAAIQAAYPEIDPWAVYDVWTDCMESVAYCAEWVRREAGVRI